MVLNNQPSVLVLLLCTDVGEIGSYRLIKLPLLLLYKPEEVRDDRYNRERERESKQERERERE